MIKKADQYKSHDPNYVKKLWGYETHIVNQLQHCGKILTVNPGFCCSIHYHKDKVETFYLLRGRLVLELYERVYKHTRKPKLIGRKLLVRPLTIWPYVPHRFWAVDGQAEFLEVSSYDSPLDSIRIAKSRKFQHAPKVEGIW